MKLLHYNSFWQYMPYPVAYHHRELCGIKNWVSSFLLFSTVSLIWQSMSPSNSPPGLPLGRQANMIEKSLGIIRKDMQRKQALKCSSDRPCSDTIREEPVERDPYPYVEQLHKVRASSYQIIYGHCWSRNRLLCPLTMEPYHTGSVLNQPQATRRQYYSHSDHTLNLSLSLGMAQYILHKIPLRKHASSRYENHCTEITEIIMYVEFIWMPIIAFHRLKLKVATA